MIRKMDFKNLQIKVVVITRKIELNIFKYWAEKTEGTSIKIIKGFVIPPVKKSNIPNCTLSKNKNNVAVKLFNWFSLILNFK